MTKKKKKFRPLVFAPCNTVSADRSGRGNGESVANDHHPQTGLPVSASILHSLNAQLHDNDLSTKEAKAQVAAMQTHIMVDLSKYSSVIHYSEQMIDAFKTLQEVQDLLQMKL